YGVLTPGGKLRACPAPLRVNYYTSCRQLLAACTTCASASPHTLERALPSHRRYRRLRLVISVVVERQPRLVGRIGGRVGAFTKVLGQGGSGTCEPPISFQASTGSVTSESPGYRVQRIR